MGHRASIPSEGREHHRWNRVVASSGAEMRDYGTAACMGDDDYEQGSAQAESGDEETAGEQNV